MRTAFHCKFSTGISTKLRVYVEKEFEGFRERSPFGDLHLKVMVKNMAFH